MGLLVGSGLAYIGLWIEYGRLEREVLLADADTGPWYYGTSNLLFEHPLRHVEDT